jgi:lipid-binding SYLF domain-containing protein
MWTRQGQRQQFILVASARLGRADLASHEANLKAPIFAWSIGRMGVHCIMGIAA